MEQHLTDEQFMMAVTGESPGGTGDHLASCDSCRAEKEKMERALAGLREWTHAEAERPEQFWSRQRSAVRATRQGSATPRSRRLAWALLPAAGVLVLAGTLWLERAPLPSPVPPADPDQELLIDVQRSLERQLPAALEPAALLVQEIRGSAGVDLRKTQGERR